MNAGSFAPALVLNAVQTIELLSVVTMVWQDAVKAVCLDRVSIISEYEQRISSPSMEINCHR